MVTKSDQASKASEVKEKLEAIAGRKIDVSAEQLFKLWYPAGAYAYGDGSATWRSILFPRKACNPARLLDASGTTVTDASGSRVFLLSDIVCFPTTYLLAEPVNVVATPHTAAAGPCSLTLTHTLVNSDSDVQISVFTWDANGAAAPNIAFDWRCRVVSV